MLRSMSEESSPDITTTLNSARQEREEAEQALAERNVSFRSQLARADVGFGEVRRSLPAGTALVSFVRYDRTTKVDSTPETPRASGQRSLMTAGIVPSYIAFVMRSGDQEPSLVPLGAASSIDELVARWRRQMLGETAAQPALKPAHLYGR